MHLSSSHCILSVSTNRSENVCIYGTSISVTNKVYFIGKCNNRLPNAASPLFTNSLPPNDC